jgi:hypothetical protein
MLVPPALQGSTISPSILSRDNELIQPLSGFNAISTLAKLVNADVYLCLGEAKLLPVSVKCNRLFIIPLSIR